MVLEGHTGQITSCAFSPNGSLIATTGKDKTTRLWISKTGTLINTFPCLGEATCCSFNPPGDSLSAGDAGGNVYLLELINYKDDNDVLRKQFQDYLVVSELGREIERDSWARRPALKKGHEAYIVACAISPDGRWIVTGSADKTLKIWDVSTGYDQATLHGHADMVNCCTVSKDGRWIISGSEDRSVRIWDAAEASLAATLQGHPLEVADCDISPDGRWIASACGDMTLRLWDMDSRQELATLAGHTNSLKACAISPDGRWIVSASIDSTLKIWDANRRKETASLKGHSRMVTCCAISPDGCRIVSGSADTNLILWDMERRSQITTFNGHKSKVNACTFTPDGRWVVSTGDDKTIKVWDIETGSERLTIPLNNPGASLAVDPFRPFIFCGVIQDNLHQYDLKGVQYGPLIITPVDHGEGPTILCPACQAAFPLEKNYPGKEMTCPDPGCSTSLYINPFVVDRTIKQKKGWQFWK